MPTQTVELSGHIVDSLTLPKVLDLIIAAGGNFELERINVGKHRRDPSYARIRVIAPNAAILDDLLIEIGKQGGTPVEEHDAVLKAAPKNGVFPEGFYATTNLETHVRLPRGKGKSACVLVKDIEMDCGIVVDARGRSARVVPMSDVKRGDKVVVGYKGVRVTRSQTASQKDDVFAFMSSEASSEQSKGRLIAQLVKEIRALRVQGKKILFVASR